MPALKGIACFSASLPVMQKEVQQNESARRFLKTPVFALQRQSIKNSHLKTNKNELLMEFVKLFLSEALCDNISDIIRLLCAELSVKCLHFIHQHIQYVLAAWIPVQPVV